MKTSFAAVLTALSLLSAASVATAAKNEEPPRIPVRDFFKNPEITSFVISNDGHWLAYLKPWEKRMNIFVRPVGGGEEKRLTSMKDRDVAGFFWKGESVLYVRDFGGDENFHVFSVNVKTGAEKELTPYAGVRAEMVDDLRDVSDSEVLLSHNRRNPEVFDVYRVNVKSGVEKMVAQNPGKVAGWMTDHQGKVRVAVESDGVNTRVLYRDNEKQKFRPIKTLSFKDSFEPLLFTFDNKRLYVSSNLGRDKKSIVEYDPRTDKEIRVVYQHPDNDVSQPLVSQKRKLLTGAMVVTWKPNYVFFDPQREALHRRIESKLPDEEIRYVSNNKDEDLFVVRTAADDSMGAYYLYDAKKDSLKELAKLGTHLPAGQLATMRPIQYLSRDGLVINGYLTLPKGIPAKNLPVVVNPHGGPWHRDVWRYNPEAQLLANRGYAVLQMNFRGSTGYGRKFWEASFKEWGRKMQDDVSDGVGWLIEQGIANPKKICIYGGSYGGYATLAGLAFTPNLYACGVDYVGVSNLFTFMKTIPPYWKPFLDQMYQMVGDPVKDKDMMQAASPVFHVDKIRAPLLIAQGAKDPRVNKDESDQMVAALRKRGIDVPYIVKEDEGHGFRNEENRFEFYEAMEKFLEKHLGRR
ncbi:MAG: S9 family peptidase [Bdellovibrionaceae bacterium]|nr:S9 family peptidase [Pseudobdellovibrionaceae bacterium]MBX3032617.1 S9 family peptidase [Pseudobdellovibrionaceae bacterium]